MIEGKTRPDFAALARLLADRAETLARARAEEALLARRDDPHRWRRAQLLWPLFTKG